MLLSASIAFSQKGKIRAAHKLYDKFEFVEAAEAYLEVAQKYDKEYVFIQLGNCYYNVFKTEEAEQWYKRALETSREPEVIFRYAEMLKANQKYEAYNQWMKLFASLSPQDSRAKIFLRNPNYLPELLVKEDQFELRNISEINTALSEFGGIIKDNTLYFCSSRKGGKLYGWNKQPYLDIYSSAMNADSTYGPPQVLPKEINTKYHEGTMTFSPDGNTMYFTRENYYKGKFGKDEEGKGTLNIFKAEWFDGKWDNVVPLPFNSDEFSIAHPAMNKDGDRLFFASDIPGGYGQTDIYEVIVNEDGTYGVPENLGPEVNSEGREVFPFVDEQGNLYFSSDGPHSMGGLDVMLAIEDEDGKFKFVRNIGAPVNTPSDDFSFTIFSNNKTALLASNRKGGAGDDDLYTVDVLGPFCDVKEIIEVQHAQTGKLLNNAEVSLFDDKGYKVHSKTTDLMGVVSFKAACRRAIVIEANKSGYAGAKVTLDPTPVFERKTIVRLEPVDEIVQDGRIVLNSIYFDFDKFNIRADAAFELDKVVEVMNEYPEMRVRVETHTDARGPAWYNMKLSRQRAKSTVQYLISRGIAKDRLESEGYGEMRPIYDCGAGTNCDESHHAANRRSEFIVIEE